ncbi:dihydrofolate reductase family protein [Brachybacterium saurashtrense]|uniref:Dihydrofolate reductase n=1 Tax=Brachybacterium saurashtrense TaxID=556288 RepID=A0A345YS32_9MICO|nr:dihydrofolate reductase family protein [Brachybacterium saurashtrense]AXK46734.1 dihydrofolate reductase [Brachybacterium saurashtrense]RRR22449.1 dihydrofolate reductase [Brachybacterium saurashtrense]
MRPLVITQNMTVDGAVEMLDDWFDPTDSPPDQAEILQRDSAACDAILLGRQTFEDFRGFWPQQEEDTTGITDELNAIEKYVVSSTMTDPAWQRSTILAGDPVPAVRDLTRGQGGEISLTGSIRLCHTLIAAGLVDEYRLWTYPYVQGRGRGLFPAGHRTPLTLLEHRAFSSGVTYTRWTPRKD